MLINHIPLALLVIIIFLIPYILILAYPYSIYCDKNNSNYAPWCDDLIPNIYSYVQDKHWEVGFLRCYNIYRYMFIIWGMGGVIVMGVGLKRRLDNWRNFWSDETTPLLIY